MALRFRNTENKVHIKKRLIILFIIFLLSLIIFEIGLNFERKIAKKTDMERRLPILSYRIKDRFYNRMVAHTQDIKSGKSNFSMLILSSDTLSFNIDKNSKNISNLRYEISSYNDEKIISGECDYNEKTGNVKIKLSHEKDKLKDKEIYNLVIYANYKKNTIRYYARVTRANENKLNDCLNFSKGIHNAILAKDINNLSVMEPLSDHFSNDLSKVDIHSSMSQITWGAMQLKEEGVPKVNIHEYLHDNLSLTYSYVVSDGKNRYRVKEYMKIKYSDKIYLLDYRRDSEEIFKMSSIKETDNGINFGIMKNQDFKFLFNEIGNIVAFINDGKIYEFNSVKGEIVKVFDFNGENNDDKRDDYEIRLLGMDEGGNLSFSVYGYMAKGQHEGSMGISLYRYDNTKKETKEESFVKSDMQFEFLKSEYGSTLYRSRNGNFNIMSGGTLYRINYAKNRVEKVLKDLKEDQYKESTNSRFISWTKKNRPSKYIYTIDLENEKIFKIKSKNNKKIKPLLYVGNDLIYGEISGEEGLDLNGNKITPMDNIVISDMSKDSSTIIKEYKQDNYPVSNVIKGEGTLYIKRVSKDGPLYKDVSEDIIKNTFEENEKKVYIKSSSDTSKGEITKLIMNKNDVKKRNIFISSIKMIDDKKIIMLPTPNIDKNYYIVKGGNILGEYKSLSDALNREDSNRSSIINNKKLIWSSSRGDYKKINGVNQKILQDFKNRKGKNRKYIELNNISLRQTFYFINNNSLVYVNLDSEEYLIVGYSTIGLTIYNPKKGIYETIMQGGFSKRCEDNGNRFITYLTKN